MAYYSPSNWSKSNYLWFTYGPSTDNEKVIEKALLEGANGCRLTFSYGTRELHLNRAETIRQIANKLGRRCMIIADLAGEKIRLTNFQPQNVIIKANDAVVFVAPEQPFNIKQRVFSVTSHELFSQAKVGDSIVLGDGTLVVTVLEADEKRLYGIALQDGEINPNRGLIVKGKFNSHGLTQKDVQDLNFIASKAVFDAVALSFVSENEQIRAARRILHNNNCSLPIVAKIETQDGIANLLTITDEADILMAARGDLALTMDWIDLPEAVETISGVARAKHKPWILATQIVEGLDEYVLPYRSEICDLAHWLGKGAGVMLAHETAYGKNPIRAIEAVAKMMARYAAPSPS